MHRPQSHTHAHPYVLLPQIVQLQRKIERLGQEKEDLLRDLQNRVDKVVELELMMDEVREKNKQLQVSTTDSSLRRKLTYLESKVDQLCSVNEQLNGQVRLYKLELQVCHCFGLLHQSSSVYV